MDSFPHVDPGLVYFLADLSPAPILVDPTTMVFSSEDRARFFQHFRGVADQVDFLVTIDPKLPELRFFRATHPGATVVTRVLGTKMYFIYGVFESADAASQAVHRPSRVW